jgi:murein DD-endopeptidase MepM/ murein hydrolase activator NlpD
LRPRRYTFVIADRNSGVVRQATISLRPTIAIVFSILSLPVLIGLGARWSALAEIQVLRVSNTSLEIENTSYRTATEELTTQIQALQSAVTDLSARSALDPRAARALERLPAVLKSNQSAGGTSDPSPTAMLSSSVTSPEDTFGVLRNLLEGLESRLRVVQKDVEKRQALANATPSVWPVYGWLTGGFGMRSDPFTGEAGFHKGLDISADKGQSVYATAEGTVESASYSGDYGNLIVLNHGYGLTTRYGHLSRFAVKPGDSVKKGDIIGYVGSTGRSTGSHLHYEVLSNGKLVNPLRLLANPR